MMIGTNTFFEADSAHPFDKAKTVHLAVHVPFGENDVDDVVFEIAERILGIHRLGDAVDTERSQNLLDKLHVVVVAIDHQHRDVVEFVCHGR